MPKKSRWRRKLEKKLKEFASLCITVLIILAVGFFIIPVFFVIYALAAFLHLFVGTLAILGLVEDT